MVGASRSSSTASSSRRRTSQAAPVIGSERAPEMNPSQWDAQYNGGPSQSPSPYNPSDGDGDGVGTRSCLAFRLPTTKKKEAKGKRGNSNYNDKGSQQSSQQSATSSDMRGLLDNGPSYGWESFHGNSNESDAFASPPAAIQANGRQQQISGAVWDASKTPSSWDAGTTATAASSVSPNRSRSANRGTGASKGTASTAGTASASMNSLLTPPPPSDRSQQRRLQYENESRGQQQHPQQQQRRPEQGLAASEMEPAGRRGQEAAYLPAPVNPGTSAAIHSAANAMAGRSATITSPPSIQTQTQMPTQSVFPGISNLLTPPTPTDRSERRRLQYEQEKRRAADPIGGEGVGVGGGGGGGSYNNGNYNFESSEIEPVGRRGQNAPLPPQAQQSQSQSQSQQSQSQSMSPNLGGLLTPPQPSDRREQRRQRYENEQQQQQQGQNQHPQYPPQSATTNSMPVVRLAQPFLPNSRPSSGMTSSQYARTATAASTAASPPKPPGVMSRMESADTSSSSNSDDDILNMRHDLMDDGEEDEDDEHDDDNDNYENDQNSSDLIQFSPISGQAVRIPAIDQLSPIPGRGQGQGQRSALQASVSPQSRSRAPPASARMESSDSTVSDEDMQYMRPDLQPSFTPTTELSMQTATTAAPLRTPQRQQQAYQNQQYQQHEQPQQPQQQPQRRQEQQSGLAAISPVAAAAAAAAAAAPKSRLRGDELDDRAREIETASVDTLNAKAMEHVQAEDFDVALQLFARVLAIHQKRDGQLHPTVASSYHNLGTVHAKRAALTTEDSVQQQHCRAQALECFQAAARVARDSLGHNHPNVAVSLVRIGFLLLQSRQYQNAIITFKEALRIRLAHYGAQHGLVANLYNNLGVCHMHLGQFGEGSEFLDSGLDIQRHIANETQWLKKNDRWINLLELADTLFNIGGLCLEWIRRQGPDARRAVDAENAFAEAFEIRTRVLGPKDPMVLQVKSLLDMSRALPRPKSRSVSPGRHRMEQEGYRSASSPGQGRSVTPSEAYRPMTSSNGGRSMTPARESAGDASSLAFPEPPRVRRSPNRDQFSAMDSRQDTRTIAISPTTNKSLLQPSDESDVQDLSVDESRETEVRSGNGASIFRSEQERTAVTDPKQTNVRSKPAPVVEVTVSTDEGEGDGNDSSLLRGGNAETRIFVSPHLVPETSPSSRNRRKGNNGSEEVVESRFFDDEHFATDTSTEIAGSTSVMQKAFSYDEEENCLISDTGVDSEHGRVHFPLAWNKGRVEGDDKPSTNGRDIMVTRPYRGKKSASEGGLAPSANSDKSGSESVNFSTGNKDRDDVMSRARAILEANGSTEPPTSGGSDDGEADDSVDFGDSTKVRPDQDLLEDGVAPLGGKWPSATESGRRPGPIRVMLEDPMNNLRELHDEATKLLKVNDFVDALRLFEVVLECQQRRNGDLHPDVAAALHNVGIAQLRALNYPEALKAFEEAARVRKGSLGREHPQVAVSLVKVGITLLLIHRFEDALWSFREALSVRKNALGALHPSTARIYNNIGCVHVEFNDFREARRAFEAALDIQRNALSQDPDSGPLMFGSATTLCNLGYLYRYRDMHGKAALVLKEAVDLQESVLGRAHATVLSTLDTLADSCANCGHATDALKYYNMVLERFRVDGRSGSKKVLRAEAVLHYKMSRVHRHRNDRETQLDSLKLALRSVRAYSDSSNKDGTGNEHTDTLERRIQYDIRGAREQIEKEQLKWI